MPAVLTGDIIGSEKLNDASRLQLPLVLKRQMEQMTTFMPDWQHDVFQGDSFQGYTIGYAGKLFEAMAMLWCSLYALGYDARMAIGIGDIIPDTGSTLTSGGPAFVFSGRSLSTLKKQNLRLAVVTSHEDRNREWRVHATALQYVQERTTLPQAEAMALIWQKQNQAQIAEQLGIRQPAVQQRLKAAGMVVWMAMAQRYRQLFL